MIAPDSNRSATARSITIRRPLWVEEVDFGDGTVGYATDGTPVDCVRFATLGLIEGFQAELIVSGINHGANLGDDITYSGTVAAALEGVVLGLPAIAISQATRSREWLGRRRHRLRRTAAALRRAGRSRRSRRSRSPPARCSTSTSRRGDPRRRRRAARQAHLPRRAVADARGGLGPPAVPDLRPGARHDDEDGTDLTPSRAGRIAVTPLHFDLTDEPGIDDAALLRPRAPARARGRGGRVSDARTRRRARAGAARRSSRHHNQRYYALDDPEIGDDAYDALIDELRAHRGRAPGAR